MIERSLFFIEVCAGSLPVHTFFDPPGGRFLWPIDSGVNLRKNDLWGGPCGPGGALVGTAPSPLKARTNSEDSV